MRNKGKRAIIYILVSFLAAIFGIWLISYAVKAHDMSDIKISHDSGFYTEPISVTATSLNGGKIYYSIAPNSDLVEYSNPIELVPDGPDNVYRIDFYSVDKDGNYSAPIERSFLLLGEGRQISTDYLAMIWGDEDELYGYENGILVRGKTFDEYMKNNPDTNVYKEVIPANYFENTERKVSFSIFDKHGNEVVSQDCGMRVLGNLSRPKNQKSLKLTSRYEYGDKNEFSYRLFPELNSDTSSGAIDDFHSLAIQNSGDDNGYAYVRNVLCNKLAGEAGFQDTLSSETVTLWINNKYRGVYWLQNTYDKRYFSEKYGDYEGYFSVNEGGISVLAVDSDKELQNQEAAKEYNQFCEWLSTQDINDETVWEKVSATVDVDNFIQYAAIEYYVCNVDWIDNNVKTYRYFPAEGESAVSDSVFDGKYRYLLFDMDYGLGLVVFDTYGSNAYLHYLGSLVSEKPQAVLLERILRRDDCRNQFITEVLKLINGPFSTENAMRTLEELEYSQLPELEHMIENTDVLDNSLWIEDECDFETVGREKIEIEEFLVARPFAVVEEMNRYWGCGDFCTVYYAGDGVLSVSINGSSVSKALCVENVPVSLANSTLGVTVEGWLINDYFIEGEEVTFYPGDYMTDDRQIAVTPIYCENDESTLIIGKAYTRGNNDKIIIENNGLYPINLEDYAISDTEDNLLKAALPDYVLEPGLYIEVYGEKYELEKAENYFQVDFSWNETEKVYLSHKLNGIVDER